MVIKGGWSDEGRLGLVKGSGVVKGFPVVKGLGL